MDPALSITELKSEIERAKNETIRWITWAAIIISVAQAFVVVALIMLLR